MCSEFRQDMGGVGGFIRENRTLYIGRITVTDDIEDVVRRQFGQFGPLERGKKDELSELDMTLTPKMTDSENFERTWCWFCNVQDESKC